MIHISTLTIFHASQMTNWRGWCGSANVRPPKVAVSVRLDAKVLEWLKSKGEGHLTRINDILANVMEAEQKARRS